MILKDKVIYAGLTTDKGVEFFNSIPNQETGYTFIRIIDGEDVGNKISIKSEKEINMYIETKKETFLNSEVKNFLEVEGVIYAGVNNLKGVELFNTLSEPYTGKSFVRIHDGLMLGNKIQLGVDYSYNSSTENPRNDSACYYAVVDIKETND